MDPSPLGLLLAVAHFVPHWAAAVLPPPGALLVLAALLGPDLWPAGRFPSTTPVVGDPAMAYLNRNITLLFDGESTLDFADEEGKPIVLPNLGDGVRVTIRNPMLMPQSMLMPKVDVATNPDGTPVDRREAILAGAGVIAGLIVEWNLTDVLNYDDDAPVLPLPATGEVIRDHIPSAVGDTIGTVIGRARNPR